MSEQSGLHRGESTARPLSPELLRKMHAYWRAAIISAWAGPVRGLIDAFGAGAFLFSAVLQLFASLKRRWIQGD